MRASAESVVFTDEWWVPQALAQAFFDKSIFLVSGREQTGILLDRLARRGAGAFLFITSDAGRPPDPQARVIEDEGLGFFSLWLERHALPAR